MERTCKKCGETKLIEKFTKNKNCKNGFNYICRRCTTIYKTLLRQNNIVICRLKEKEYANKNRDVLLLKRKKNRDGKKCHYSKKGREYAKQAIERLTDSYIVNGIFTQMGISQKILYQHYELIEVKREQIKLLRLIKKQKNEKCN